jgi:hypothetical protein
MSTQLMSKGTFVVLLMGAILVSQGAQAAAKRLRDEGLGIVFSSVSAVRTYRADYPELTGDRYGIVITGTRLVGTTRSAVTLEMGSQSTAPGVRSAGTLESCVRFATIAMSNPTKWNFVVLADLSSGDFNPGAGSPLIVDGEGVLAAGCSLERK